jgi:peptide deformylase
MALRGIRIYGDPVLRAKATDVTTFDDSLRSLVADLFETMKAYRGVGLAAPQVGVSQRVFVVDVPVDETTRERFAVINPVISQKVGKESGEEGCLSMPGIYEEVVRAEGLLLKYVDENGQSQQRAVEGYLARAIQHEADHLDGVLFTDRLGPLKKQFLRRQLDALARGEVPEGYHPPQKDEETL